MAFRFFFYFPIKTFGEIVRNGCVRQQSKCKAQMIAPNANKTIGGDSMFKEVKRKAAVGERIKIVKPEMAFDKYKAGDVFVVDRVDSALGVYVDAVKYPEGNRSGFITHDEYVVLEPVAPAAPPTDLTQAFAQFLRENAGAIRKYLDEIGLDTAEPDAPKPLTRAEVIEKAREDVAELIRIGRSIVEFHVNREKRVVTALIKPYRGSDGKVRAKGIAKCAPGDVFHVEIGKAIALRKALGLTIPTEYTDAPQPDEPRVGAVVKANDPDIPWTTTLTERFPKMDGYYGKAWRHTHDSGWIGEKQFYAIDDTDVDYGAGTAKEAA